VRRNRWPDVSPAETATASLGFACPPTRSVEAQCGNGALVVHSQNSLSCQRSPVMVVLEFGIFPLDKGESVGQYVARSLEIVDASGLDYRCHAMGTVLEGEFDQVMDVVAKCFHAMAADCNRIECSLKFDYRKGHQGRLDSKVRSVEQKLGRELKK
jgi:uncharacterized protein (TIGR00106 family)